MYPYLGDFPVDATVYFPFHTFDSNGASITLTGLAVTDIEIFKNGVATARASDAGYTLLDTDGIDFASVTGIHGFKVDLSNNGDAGFYAAGNEYMVVVSAVTIDTQTVNFVAGAFSIERAGGALALAKSSNGFAAIKAETALIVADTGTDGVVVSSSTQTSMADTMLNRDMSAVSDTNARSPLNAFRQLRNKWTIVGSTLTVYKEDDSTTAWTSTLTTSGSAQAVTASAPT